MGIASLRLFHISSNNGIVGEHIWAWSGIECVASRSKAATFGVEKDEVVGEIGGRRDEVFYVEGME